MDKKEYRQKAKAIRAGLDIKRLSAVIQDKIRTVSAYIEAEDVLLYYPKAGELDLLGLIEDNKNFYLPRMTEDDIVLCPWQYGDKLLLSKYNIYEPLSEPVDFKKIDLIILPGLCADKNKNRLGYGKGCYDRVLEKSPGPTIFAVPDELIFENIPVDEYDKKADILVSQSMIMP